MSFINNQLKKLSTSLLRMLMLVISQAPIVLMHGFNSKQNNMRFMKSFIEGEIPDAFVINCEVGDGILSSIFWEIDDQVDALYKCIKSYKETQNGYIGVGHSQGGYLMRALLQKYNHIGPPMLRFISLAGPLGGFFCGNKSECAGVEFPGIFSSFIYSIEYSYFAQKYLGAAQYWRDPYNLQEYTEKARSLPLLDNIRNYDEQRKVNFMSVDKIIVFGGPNDGVISPWQSAHFGVWKNGTDKKVAAFDQRREYKDDTFGLRSMVEQGRVIFEQTLLSHGEYPYDVVFIKETLVPYLKMK